MKIEKVTEKIELNVCAQKNDCMNDCKVWKAASDYVFARVGKFSGCYQGYSPKWTARW